MTGTETISTIIGSLFAGAVFTFLFLGKMVNKQVSRSFEHSINGDGEGSLGLRSGLKELRANVEKITEKVSAIEQTQALIQQSLTYRDERCDQKHVEVERRFNEIKK